MANVRVLESIRNARLNAIRDAIDAGAAGGQIRIYTGTQATNANTALGAQTLLGTLTFSGTSASNASGGVLTFSAITQDSAADATGTATWARITDSDGNTVFDCDVGTSGTTMILNTASIVAGGPIVITSFTLTDAAA